MRLLLLTAFMLAGGTAMSAEREVRIVVFIKATPEQVWKAIVSPDAVRRYYPCGLRHIGSAVGERIEYGSTDEPFITGKISEITPHERLVHSFQFVGGIGEQPVVDLRHSQVSYDLAKDGNATRLTLTHSDFGDDEQSYSNVADTWPWVLSSLKSMLETGKSLSE